MGMAVVELVSSIRILSDRAYSSTTSSSFEIATTSLAAESARGCGCSLDAGRHRVGDVEFPRCFGIPKIVEIGIFLLEFQEVIVVARRVFRGTRTGLMRSTTTFASRNSSSRHLRTPPRSIWGL